MNLVHLKLIHSNIENYAGKEIQVGGWIRTMRVSKNFGFIELNDGSNFKNTQIVFDNEISNFDKVSKQSVGAAIIVKGVVIHTPDQKQPFEIKAIDIEIEGESNPRLPITEKATQLRVFTFNCLSETKNKYIFSYF